ncbi:MAG: signal peptidase I [Clostridia bacterium]|nr:signal peptidase I [Clostridia bacterium]
MTETKKQQAKKIFNVITTVIFAVVFIFLVVIVVFSVIQRKEGKDVKIFGHYMFVVMTDSMTPTIEPKEAIWCKAPEDGDIVEGAIITFTAPSGVLKGQNETHRIEKIEYDESGNIAKIYTKGDKEGLPTDDWILEESDVKAVYVRTMPLISGIMRFVLEKPFIAYVVLIALPLIIVAILFIVGFVRDRLKKEKSEEDKPKLDDLSDDDKKKLLENYLKGADTTTNNEERMSEETSQDGSTDSQN